MNGGQLHQLLPAQPLLELPELQRLNATEIAGRVGVTRRTVERWKAGTQIHHRRADQIACDLGLHPLLIWPDF